MEPKALFALVPNRKNIMETLELKHCLLGMTSISKEDADTLLEKCLALPTTNGMGRRKIAQFGSDYAYSGVHHKGQAIPEWMQEVIDSVNELLDAEFNSVLMNVYPKGVNTGIGFHQDNEPELKSDVVVSLSLGCSETFIVKNKSESVDILLEHGDVLVMGSGCQQHYHHGIAYKTMPETRVSLTFRQF
jgi:alkylated DNA repair dioxygenase AlkB